MIDELWLGFPLINHPAHPLYVLNKSWFRKLGENRNIYKEGEGGIIKVPH